MSSLPDHVIYNTLRDKIIQDKAPEFNTFSVDFINNSIPNNTLEEFLKFISTEHFTNLIILVLKEKDLITKESAFINYILSPLSPDSNRLEEDKIKSFLYNKLSFIIFKYIIDYYKNEAILKDAKRKKFPEDRREDAFNHDHNSKFLRINDRPRQRGTSDQSRSTFNRNDDRITSRERYLLDKLDTLVEIIKPKNIQPISNTTTTIEDMSHITQLQGKINELEATLQRVVSNQTTNTQGQIAGTSQGTGISQGASTYNTGNTMEMGMGNEPINSPSLGQTSWLDNKKSHQSHANAPVKAFKEVLKIVEPDIAAPSQHMEIEINDGNTTTVCSVMNQATGFNQVGIGNPRSCRGYGANNDWVAKLRGRMASSNAKSNRDEKLTSKRKLRMGKRLSDIATLFTASMKVDSPSFSESNSILESSSIPLNLGTSYGSKSTIGKVVTKQPSLVGVEQSIQPGQSTMMDFDTFNMFYDITPYIKALEECAAIDRQWINNMPTPPPIVVSTCKPEDFPPVPTHIPVMWPKIPTHVYQYSKTADCLEAAIEARFSVSSSDDNKFASMAIQLQGNDHKLSALKVINDNITNYILSSDIENTGNGKLKSLNSDYFGLIDKYQNYILSFDNQIILVVGTPVTILLYIAEYATTLAVFSASFSLMSVLIKPVLNNMSNELKVALTPAKNIALTGLSLYSDIFLLLSLIKAFIHFDLWFGARIGFIICLKYNINSPTIFNKLISSSNNNPMITRTIINKSVLDNYEIYKTKNVYELTYMNNIGLE